MKINTSVGGETRRVKETELRSTYSHTYLQQIYV